MKRKIFKQICRVLKEPRWKIRYQWLKLPTRAELKGNLIKIDPYTPIVEAAVHEAIHDLYPTWSPELVRKYEETMTGWMNRKRMKLIYQIVSEKAGR